MANITFVIEDEQLRQMKIIAAKHQTSINALVRDYFSHLTASGLADSDGMNGNLQTLFDYSIGKIGRHKAKSFLGVDDFMLTDMLRSAKLPPPRATVDEENRMLEEIKNIRFA